MFTGCFDVETNTYQEQERVDTENSLEAWCERLLEVNFEV